MPWSTGTGLTSPPLQACPAQDQLMLASGRPQWHSQHALQLSPDQLQVQGDFAAPSAAEGETCLEVTVCAFPGGCLLHSPTPPFVIFCANKCFPGESEFIMEMESRDPQPAHSNRNGEGCLAGRPPRLVHCLPCWPGRMGVGRRRGRKSAPWSGPFVVVYGCSLFFL